MTIDLVNLHVLILQQDIKTIAETSVTVLLEKKENKENIMIPTKIIKRESLKGDSPCM